MPNSAVKARCKYSVAQPIGTQRSTGKKSARAIEAAFRNRLRAKSQHANARRITAAIRYPSADNGIKMKLSSPGSLHRKVSPTTVTTVATIGQNSHLSPTRGELRMRKLRG